MRILLVVSCVSPLDWIENGLHGIHKRLEMFIDALKEVAKIDILFYVQSHIEISQSITTKIKHIFFERWNIQVNLFFCHMFTYGEALPKWYFQSQGIINFFKHPSYIPTSGSKQIRAFEECLQRQPQAIFAHRLLSMCPVMLTRQPLPPIFFDLDDVEPIAFARKLRQPPSQLSASAYYLQVPALWWGTVQAIRLAQRTFVCSKQDQNLLTNQWGLSGVVTIPNAVAIPKLQPLTSDPTLLLLGSYTFPPNVNAANFLIEQVWQRIYRNMPQARLIVAGKAPNRIRSYSNGVPGVEFTGFVADLDTLYQRIRVVCCPIFSGSGTRIKMVEAAAYGKPIVASQIGAEGLEMQHEQEFLLADKSNLFAESCLQLLNNQALCEKLGKQARTAAIQYYDRRNIVQLIQSSITSALDLTLVKKEANR